MAHQPPALDPLLDGNGLVFNEQERFFMAESPVVTALMTKRAGLAG
jgi:hypothetical protein